MVNQLTICCTHMYRLYTWLTYVLNECNFFLVYYNTKKEPIKVLMVNPLVPSSQLIILKILSGEIFGDDSLIDLNLFVGSQEIMVAEVLKCELKKCAFSNTRIIEISTDLPQVNDADIFCFMSNFENPNYLCIENMENEIQVDIFYFLTKLADNLSWPTDKEQSDVANITKRRPILVADGLVALNILMSFSRNLPHDIFYCPSPVEAISKSLLGDYLNVPCNQINDVLVWGANDKIFHVEVEKPVIISDKLHNASACDSITMSKELLQSLKLDYTQFNSSWMRKEFLEKVASSAARNPYGCIYKAAEFAKSLKQIWKARSSGSGMKVYSNMGVISDGSIGTMKGYPYFLPLILKNDSWEVNKNFEDSLYLRQEMKRINTAVVEQRQMLIPYCKKILKENKIKFGDMQTDNESSTICGDSTSSSFLREQHEH